MHYFQFISRLLTLDALLIDLIRANATKWSNTLKKSHWLLPTICLSVFDQFLGLTLNGLIFKSWFLRLKIPVSICWRNIFVFKDFLKDFTRNWKSMVIVYIRSISYLMSGVVVMICKKKKSKSHETRIFAQSRQGRWILFLDLELGKLFISKICFWNTTDFTYYLSSIIQRKTFSSSSSCFKTCIICLLIDFTNLESLFS